MQTRTDPSARKHHLPMLLALASFSALFIVIGFIAGWELRWTEDVYDERHNIETAERAASLAAAMTEDQVLRIIKSDLCKPGEQK